MKVRGIKRGQTIELLEVLNVPDGEQVTVEVDRVHPLSQLTPEERQQRINSVLTVWQTIQSWTESSLIWSKSALIK